MARVHTAYKSSYGSFPSLVYEQSQLKTSLTNFYLIYV